MTFLDDSTSLANSYTTSADLDTKENKQKPSLIENTIWERNKWAQIKSELSVPLLIKTTEKIRGRGWGSLGPYPLRKVGMQPLLRDHVIKNAYPSHTLKQIGNMLWVIGNTLNQ